MDKNEELDTLALLDGLNGGRRVDEVTHLGQFDGLEKWTCEALEEGQVQPRSEVLLEAPKVDECGRRGGSKEFRDRLRRQKSQGRLRFSRANRGCGSLSSFTCGGGACVRGADQRSGP